jgi:hypothetical protein
MVLFILNRSLSLGKKQPHLHELMLKFFLFYSEDLMAALEENKVTIQNHLSSKNISFFRTTLTELQNKLIGIDRAITIWLNIQYHLTHRRPIFIGIKFIRKQLSKQSETLKELMNK